MNSNNIDIFTNASPLDAIDELEESAKTGGYEEAEAVDDLEEVMNAADDLTEIAELPDIDAIDDINTMLIHLDGRNPDGSPKASITLLTEAINRTKNVVRTVVSHSVFGPSVRLEGDDEYVRVVIVGDGEHKHDLETLIAHVEEYFDISDRMHNPSEETLSLYCAIVPMEDKGTRFLVAFDPIMWGLTRKTKDGVAAECLTLVFNANNLVFCSDDDFDMSVIDAEIDREIRDMQERERLKEEEDNA